MNILKKWKLLVLVFFIIISVYSLMPTSEKGVIVKSVAYDSPLAGKIKEGESITWINEKTISNVDDFYAFDNFKGVLRFMHNGELELANVDSSGLKVVVVDADSSKLNLGMDLVGGTRVLLKPVENNVSEDLIDQTIVTLETRINTYGLRESKFQKVKDVSGNTYAQIEMAGGSIREIEDLLSKQGKFEAKMLKAIMLENGKGIYGFNGVDYPITLSGDSMVINGKAIDIGDSFEIDDVEIEYLNSTNSTVFLMPLAFTGTDVKSVCMQEQPGICASRVVEQGKGYMFMFQVFLSQEAAERFAKITKDAEIIVDPNTADSYLDTKMVLFLDDKMITELSISSDLAGRALTDPSITGGRATKEETVQQKMMLQSILSSGELPIKMETIRVDQISPVLGEEFGRSAMLAGAAAIIAVSAVIFIRYRKIKIVVPILITIVSEALITLGVASLIGWTIDLSAIAGIIAAVGTGVDDQIIMIDELGMGKEKLLTFKQKIKQAFFIIFGAASTVIAAMLPLMFIGIGVMKGFAITTTICILVGIFVTRPAFSQMIENIMS